MKAQSNDELVPFLIERFSLFMILTCIGFYSHQILPNAGLEIGLGELLKKMGVLFSLCGLANAGLAILAFFYLYWARLLAILVSVASAFVVGFPLLLLA